MSADLAQGPQGAGSKVTARGEPSWWSSATNNTREDVASLVGRSHRRVRCHFISTCPWQECTESDALLVETDSEPRWQFGRATKRDTESRVGSSRRRIQEESGQANTASRASGALGAAATAFSAVLPIL